MLQRGIILTLGIAPLLLGQETSYVISTIAGSDWVGDGGPATQALLQQAEGVAIGPQGTVYFSDALGHRIREVRPDGTIRTVAGTGRRGFAGDGGPATQAELNAPYGVAVDLSGNLFIADLGNSRVRKVGADGLISTVAAEPLRSPRNVAVSDTGAIYISDFDAHRVYALNQGKLTVFAGTGVAEFQGEAGPADQAQLGHPAALAWDRATGAVYIGDTYNRAIRKVSGGIITTIARIAAPTGMSFDSSGTLHIADPVGGGIYHITRSGATTLSKLYARDVAATADGALYAAAETTGQQILPSGIVLRIAGGGNPAFGDGGKASAARLNHPTGVAADTAGNIYVADRDNHRVRKITPGGIINTIAGTGTAGNTGDGGPATQAQLDKPSSVSLDTAGNLYIADTGNGRIRIVSPQGIILAGPAMKAPIRVLADPSGGIYMADEKLGLLHVKSGVSKVLVDSLKSPGGFILDAVGNLYFSEADAARVRRLSPSGQITDVAPGAWRSPRGLALDAQGNLIVSDPGRQQVVRIDSTGRIIAIAGTGVSGFSGDNDAAFLARLSSPWDIASGPAGVLFIVDLDNNRIRQLTPTTLSQSTPVTLPEAFNAASQLAGPLSPWMLVELRGTGIQPTEITQTEFLFGNAPAEFVSIDRARILVLSPATAPVEGGYSIQVRHQGLARVTIPATGAPASPALFTVNGHASASNQDGTANTPTNTAEAGSVVAIYGTGAGVGEFNATARIGSQSAEVLYAGPCGLPGIFQINLRIPLDATGERPVIITVGDASSPPATLSVRSSVPQM